MALSCKWSFCRSGIPSLTSETATNGRTRDAAPAGRKKLPTRLSSLFPKVTGTIKQLGQYYKLERVQLNSPDLGADHHGAKKIPALVRQVTIVEASGDEGTIALHRLAQRRNAFDRKPGEGKEN